MTFQVSYTAKDLILYALSLGMGSTKQAAEDGELKYLYENHEFRAVPTFYLAFTFWAVAMDGDGDRHKTMHSSSMNGIPAFPPPIMAKEQVIPKRFLNSDKVDLSNFPVIHTWQSITWHDSMRIPKRPLPGKRHDDSITVDVDMSTISVQPKSIGTFVTSQTQIKETETSKSNRILASMQSTALVMGISPDDVLPYDTGLPRQSILRESTFFANRKRQQRRNESTSSLPPPDFEWTYQTTPSQALLYRLASGDSNHIHVDTSVSEMMGNGGNNPQNKPAPIMHGLFTMALAFRGITKYIQSTTPSSSKVIFHKLEGKFTQPVFIGDSLVVKIWRDWSTLEDENGKKDAATQRFAFVIANQKKKRKVVDCGCAQVEVRAAKSSNGRMSRL